MKSYTFKATPKDTDYQRICRENHQARFLVVRSEGMPAITFVRLASDEHCELHRVQGALPGGRVEVPPLEHVEGRTGQTWLVFEGDFSKELAPKVLTTVEVY
jgi:hypothetical protein